MRLLRSYRLQLYQLLLRALIVLTTLDVVVVHLLAILGSLLAFGQSRVLNMHVLRFVVVVRIRLLASAFLRFLWLLFVNRSGTLRPRCVPLLIHPLPIVLDLVIRNRWELFQDHLKVHILNKAELAEIFWFLRLIKDVLHNYLVDLVSLTHLREGSPSFVLFVVLCRIYFFQLLTNRYLTLSQPVHVLGIYATEFELNGLTKVVFSCVDHVLLCSLDFLERNHLLVH